MLNLNLTKLTVWTAERQLVKHILTHT